MVSGRSDAIGPHQARHGGRRAGGLHRRRAPLGRRMDDQYEFVAGALSADAKKRMGIGCGSWALRRTASTRTSAKWRRPRRSAADGIEAVSIVTPNNVHVPAAMAFIEAGIHVICDKPLALNLKEAKALEKLLAKNPDVILRSPTILGLPVDPPRQGHGEGGRAR